MLLLFFKVKLLFLSLSVIIPFSVSLVHHLLFGVNACCSFVNVFCCFLHLYRRRRPRPELCGVFLGAAHVGPSLSQPHWLSEFGAEGVGDGWPSLPRQMQPLKEEWQRGGIYLTLSSPVHPRRIHRATCSSHCFFCCCFFPPLGPVPAVRALLGLRVADDESVPSSFRVHRGLPDCTEWQHVDPTLQYFPLQFSQTASSALNGEKYIHSIVNTLVREHVTVNSAELLYNTLPHMFEKS